MTENNITLNFVQEKAIDREGKVVTNPQSGEVDYVQDDLTTLIMLLLKYDHRKHGSFFKESKIWLAVKDKLRKAWLEKKESAVLTLDEASFVKSFLRNLPENEGKDQPLREYEARTMHSIIDQLG